MKNKTVSIINENLAEVGVVCIISTFKKINWFKTMESKTFYLKIG